jgi:hypothetical protein
MRRCEDEKVFYRPPLLEEPCAQTLWGKMGVFKMVSKGLIQKDSKGLRVSRSASDRLLYDSLSREALERAGTLTNSWAMRY